MSLKKGGIFTLQTATDVAAWEDCYLSVDKDGLTLTESPIRTGGHRWKLIKDRGCFYIQTQTTIAAYKDCYLGINKSNGQVKLFENQTNETLWFITSASTHSYLLQTQAYASEYKDDYLTLNKNGRFVLTEQWHAYKSVWNFTLVK